MKYLVLVPEQDEIHSAHDAKKKRQDDYYMDGNNPVPNDELLVEEDGELIYVKKSNSKGQDDEYSI